MRNLLHTGERADYGVIATLESADGSVVQTREFRSIGGRVKNATCELADYCDRHGLYVTCISSPQTIYADLKGRDDHLNSHAPESIILGQIGRMNLLHPRVAARRKDTRGHRRKG